MIITLQIISMYILLIIGWVFLFHASKAKKELFIIIDGLIIIFAVKIFPIPESTQTYCEKNHISYELVETIAEVCDREEKDIAIALSFAAEGGYDVYDGVRYVMPNTTNEEIFAIISISDRKQKLNEH